MKKTEKAEKRPVGRPTDYRPEFAREAQKLCKLGATNEDLADFFQVSIPTIWAWSCKHAEFLSAIRVSKGAPDDRTVRSLYQRANGYTYEAEEIHIIEGEVVRVPVRKHVPPDVGACKYWTMNRLPDDWREQRSVEENAPGGVTISGGFSGTVTVKSGAASGDQTPDTASEPNESISGLSEES